jgi:hypothetical protein
VKRAARWLLACVAGWWCLAHAAAAADAPAPPAPSARTEATEAYDAALRALAAGDWADAQLMLERTLMLAPEHAEARVELAVLLAQRGEVDAARALLRSLLADPRTPELQARRITALVAALDAGQPGAATGPSVVASFIETGLVRQRNPLARARLSDLTLTLPGGPVTLPLDQQVAPATLAYLRVRVGLPGDAGLEAVVLEPTTAQPPDSPLRTNGSVALFGQAALGDTPLQWLVGTVRAPDGFRRDLATVALPARDWRLALTALSEPQVGNRGVIGRVERGWMPADGRWLALGYADLEVMLRGSPSQLRAGVVAQQMLPGTAWVFTQQLQLHTDLEGYSPLLADNAPRRLATGLLAADWARPVSDDWTLTLRLQASARAANIDLFEYTDLGVQVGLRHVFR